MCEKTGTGSLSGAAEIFVLGTMGFVLLITGVHVGVEWMGSFPAFAAYAPRIFGYARTVICAALVFGIGSAGLTSRDTLLLVASFALALVGDWILIVTKSNLVLGAGVFLVVHILLSVRHARGFRDSLTPKRRSRTLTRLVATLLVVAAVTGLLLWTVMPVLQRSGRGTLEVIYVVVLSTSMWMGWGTLIRDAYPRMNAWFIAVGITCFYLCDVSVGLAADLEGTTFGSVLSVIVDVFYTPALVLLAVSGYRFASSQNRGVRFLER